MKIHETGSNPEVVTGLYFYDGDGNRVKTIADGKTTYYIGNYYEKIVEGTSTTIKKYYYSGEVRVAMNDNGDIRYFVTDHLGSTTKLINTDGTEYSDMEYLSWGSDKITPPDIGTSFKYTGQREAEAGLYFYNARWYDPELGRFIQADTIIPSPGNPMAWDRYSYTLSNPINLIDLSGHRPCDLYDARDQCITMTADKALKEFNVTIKGLSNNEKIDQVFYYEITGGKFAGLNLEGETIQEVFTDVFGPVVIEVGPGKGPGSDSNGKYLGNCVTVGNVISCDSPMDAGNTIHELFHVFDNHYDALNGTSGSLGSYNWPAEWLDDGRYNHDAYKCTLRNCSDSQAHPPSLTGYSLTEAFANAGQNWVLEATIINPASYGFSDNVYGNQTRDKFYNLIQQYLGEMGLKGG